MSITSSKTANRQRLIPLISASIALLLGILQLCFYLTGYEFDTGLYQHGPLPTVTAILWILSGGAVIALSLTLPKKELFEEFCPPNSQFSDFASLIAAIALIAFPVCMILFRSNPTDSLSALLASSAESDSTARTTLLISLFLAIPAAIHFFLFFYKRINHPLGVSAALFFSAATALRVYFDMRYLLMSPQRILHLMALLSVMVFLIAEMRLSRGLGNRKSYFATASLCVVFAFADTLANLVLSLMSLQALGAEITVYFFLLAMALYAFSRMFSFTYNEHNQIETQITLVHPTEDKSPPSSEESPLAPHEETDQ